RLVAQHRELPDRPESPEGRGGRLVAEIDDVRLEPHAVLVERDEHLLAERSERMEVEAEHRLPGVPGGGEPGVQGEGGGNEREMGEGLREVAEMLRLGAELLAVETEVIGIAEHLLEDEASLVQVSQAGETLHVPERAHRERPFLSRESVGEAAV